MKILHRHILGSHLSSLGITLVIFTFVLILGNVVKDIMAQLADRSLGLGTVLHLFLLILPYALSFSMPMALLAATLLVMGRISADNELTAARSCGVSFFELVLPILGVAGGLSLMSLYVNCSLAPKMKYEFNQMFIQIAFEQPMSLLQEGVFMRDFEDTVVFIGKRDTRLQMIYDVRITKLSSGEMTEQLYAESGKVSANLKEKKLKITLFKVRRDERQPGEVDNPAKRRWAETSETFPLELDMTKLVNQRHAVQEIHHKTSWQLWKELEEWKAQGNRSHPTPKLMELHKRAALSLACVAFVLIALPLGVQVHRRESSVGILISLVLSVFYYFLVLLAESFKKYPEFYPELVIWIPNFIFEAIGLFLLWRQNRL